MLTSQLRRVLLVLVMQPSIWTFITPKSWHALQLALPWQLTVATVISFGICCMGKRPAEKLAGDAEPSDPIGGRVRARIAAAISNGGEPVVNRAGRSEDPGYQKNDDDQGHGQDYQTGNNEDQLLGPAG